MDNNDVNLADPPMSSVVPNSYRTGCEAAALLARMMAGERIGQEAHSIEPISVKTAARGIPPGEPSRIVGRALRARQRGFASLVALRLPLVV